MSIENINKTLRPLAGGQHRSRREFLYSLGATLGSVALTALLQTDSAKAASAGPLSPKKGHLPSKAKNCIFLMMEGGPSHIDTFDPKPKLEQLHLQEFVRQGEMKSAMESGTRYFVQSPFKFRKAGQSGADIAENWQHLAACVDDICFYRGCQVDSVNHPTAMYQMNTGDRFGGGPNHADEQHRTGSVTCVRRVLHLAYSLANAKWLKLK